MGELIKVAETKDLPPGEAMSVEVAGVAVALFNVNGSYYAIADTCTHAGGSLSEGEMDGTVVTCPLHGATFDVRSGNVLAAPAPTGVSSYQLEVDGNDIKIEVP